MKALKVLTFILLAAFSFSSAEAQIHHHHRVYHRHHHVIVRHHRH